MEKTKLDVDSFKLDYTEVNQIKPKLDKLKKAFFSHKTKDTNFRLDQLKKLRRGIDKYAKEIGRTNYLDLGFGDYSNDINTMAIVLSDIDYIISNFQDWAKPRSVHTPLLLAPSTSCLFPEPYGVCVIFSAWNSQYQTLLQPMAAALAAGNCVLAKPSEMAPYSAKLMEYIFEYLDPDVVQIVQGGGDQCIELNKHKSDIIVFTGSPMKGVLVSKAAAEFLTPCILELGGQNPVIVDETADLKNTAYNLVNGRFIISGQACIAPEYVFVHRSNYEKLLALLKETVENFFGKNPQISKDYSRIINEWHTDRLANLLKTHGGNVLVGGGECNIKEKYVPPTIIHFESIEKMSKSSLAKEEIFGPILYLCPFDNINDCIEYINSREKPLSMYYFGYNKKNKELIKKNTSSGGLVFNDTIVHFASHYLPFGGVGSSGYSAYHGKYGFDNLSHLKPIVDRSSTIVPFRYPPYSSSKLSLMRKLIGLGSLTQSGVVKSFVYLGLIVAAFLLRNNLYAGMQGFMHGNPKF